MADHKIRVVVWDENPGHAPKELYPENIRGAVAEGLNALGEGRIEARVAHLDEPEQGLPASLLAETDVLFWWGHVRHREVSDETAARVLDRVHNGGMGFVALHSAHYSRTFRQVLGATGHLKGGWRETKPLESEVITVCAPQHPIVQGVDGFTLEHEEMYGAPFDVPPPACVILQSYYPHGGEFFPSGLTWTVGPGKVVDFESGPGGGTGQGEGKARVFYFRPGHETVPTYFHDNVRRILRNAALWCARAE